MKTKELALLFYGMKVPMSEMEKLMNELIKDELTDYTKYLLKAGYCDSDVYCEGNTAIDRYMHPELRDK